MVGWTGSAATPSCGPLDRRCRILIVILSYTLLVEDRVRALFKEVARMPSFVLVVILLAMIRKSIWTSVQNQLNIEITTFNLIRIHQNHDTLESQQALSSESQR